MSRIASGQAQTPLNYLQRRIARSKRFDPTTKRHVMILIRKAKATISSEEHAVSEACRLWSYSQMLRLEALLDTMDTGDKRYKATLWARCKVSEDYRKYLSSANISKPKTNGHGQAKSSALWSSPKADDVPPKPDADTA